MLLSDLNRFVRRRRRRVLVIAALLALAGVVAVAHGGASGEHVDDAVAVCLAVAETAAGAIGAVAFARSSPARRTWLVVPAQATAESVLVPRSATPIRAGPVVVKPRRLPKVDRELWLTRQEFYIGRPKEDASVEKMVAKAPDVIAFNGYATQYYKKRRRRRPTRATRLGKEPGHE